MARRVSHGGALFAASLVLAAVAGWVDAISLIKAHDLFVSFMSGNTTHLAVGVAGAASGPTRPAAVIGAFLAGVIAGELIAGPKTRSRRGLVLACETAVLAIAWGCESSRAPMLLTCALLAVAMGTQNASVHEAGGVSVALTYVTGAYVHFGRSIANALARRAPLAEAAPYGALIVALGAGALGGAVALKMIGGYAIAVAAATCLLLSFIIPALPREQDAAPG